MLTVSSEEIVTIGLKADKLLALFYKLFDFHSLKAFRHDKFSWKQHTKEGVLLVCCFHFSF